MSRFAMVEADGAVRSILETSNPLVVDMNTPPGCRAVGCGSEVAPGWRMDDQSESFIPGDEAASEEIV